MSAPLSTAQHEALIMHMPESVRTKLGELLPGEQIAHVINSDMQMDGTYTTDSWLVVTTRKLMVLDTAHAGGELMLPLTSLSSARIRQLYGNAVLELRLLDEATPDLLLTLSEPILPVGPSVDAFRFSRSLEDTMFEVADNLQSVLLPAAHNQPIESQVKKEEDLFSSKHKGRCRSCGRVLPRGQQVCPRCLNKRKLLGRAFQYVAPYKWLFIANFLVTAILSALSLVPPLLNKILVDEV